jgi:hypothetical protein
MDFTKLHFFALKNKAQNTTLYGTASPRAHQSTKAELDIARTKIHMIPGPEEPQGPHEIQ